MPEINLYLKKLSFYSNLFAILKIEEIIFIALLLFYLSQQFMKKNFFQKYKEQKYKSQRRIFAGASVRARRDSQRLINYPLIIRGRSVYISLEVRVERVDARAKKENGNGERGERTIDLTLRLNRSAVQPERRA